MSVTCSRRASRPGSTPGGAGRGRGPGAAAPAWWAFSGAAAAAAAAAASAASAAFGCRIRNPCASLTMKQSSNVPAFLSKLWTLVEETHTNEFITWSQVRSGHRGLGLPGLVASSRGLRRDAPPGARWRCGLGLAGAPGFVCREPRGSRRHREPQAARGEGRLVTVRPGGRSEPAPWGARAAEARRLPRSCTLILRRLRVVGGAEGTPRPGRG